MQFIFEDDKNYLDIAKEFWQSGKAIETGKIIFENLENDIRPICYEPKCNQLLECQEEVLKDFLPERSRFVS